MGNTRSSTTTEENDDIWYSNGAQTTSAEQVVVVEAHEAQEINLEREQRRKELAEDFEKFKQELAEKHGKRRQLIAEKRKEMAGVREELLKEKEENGRLREALRKANNNVCAKPSKEDLVAIGNLKEENEDLRNEIDKLRIHLKERDIINDKNKELRISIADMQKELQSVNTQVIGFEKERIDYQEHVNALKDIVRVSKEMLAIRENQIEELRKKVTIIEELLASKEMNVLSDDLRHEYERQLKNIRNLRTLYEERQRIDKREKENLQTQTEELRKNVEEEQKKNGELQERVNQLEEENSQKYDEIKTLESNLGLSKAECKGLQSEMAVINQLFSQILLGFNNDQDMDLDNLIKSLEENHELLTDIVVNEESNEVSALPKVLLDLVKQVNEKRVQREACTPHDGNTSLATIPEEKESQLPHQLNSPEEIVENLPKVWRVLIELLSHQCVPSNDLESKLEGDDHCYKSVQTPTGTRSVPSVSKTYIRLKDLILEKKSLEKEMSRLKHLNTHLEGRLQDQEKRLVLVSSELSKTWHVVGKMQKQHQQLHTQEKILRYELAQKRKLLTELKEELEYCRQKWIQARNKNTSTEEQWKQLRTEFASRKATITDDFSNSVESGYSDDKSSSDDDEDLARQQTPAVQNGSNEDGVQNEALVGESASISEPVGTEEVTHSPETQKTDLVQNSDEERLSLQSSAAESRSDTAEGNTTENSTTENDAIQSHPNKPDLLENCEAATKLDNEPSTSKTQSAEEFVARREERMKRLEEQCSQLYTQVTNTSMKSTQMSSKLDDLHEIYGDNSQNTATANASGENQGNVDSVEDDTNTEHNDQQQRT